MRPLPLAALFACCFFLVGCGGQDPERSEPAVVADPSGKNNGERQVDASSAELAMTDRTLRLALERPGSYLPTEVSLTDQSAVIVSDLLYDGLTEAVGDQARLRPGLAEAWWHNEDYTVWTFSLAPDVVTTESVVTSLLPFASEAAADESRPGVAARLAAGIRNVSATDAKTISVELDRPNAGLPWVLSGLPFSIVGPGEQPTGSYRVVSDDAAGLRLTARQSAPTIAARPVRIEWDEDRVAGYQKLVDGKLHGALVPPERAGEAAATFATAPAASVSTRFYVLHLGSERLADPAVRDLTRSAIDPIALVADTFSQEVVNADGLVPNTMAGYRPSPCQVCADETPIAAVAPELLDTLGPLEVAYSAADQQATTAAIVSQLQDAGIPAVEQPMDPEELAAVIVSGGTDIFSFGWVAAATSSDAILPVLLSAESPANVARIGSTEIDRILAAAAVTADDQARWDLHHQAHQAALSSGRLIPVAAAKTSLALSDGAGTVSVRADGSIDLEGHQ